MVNNNVDETMNIVPGEEIREVDVYGKTFTVLAKNKWFWDRVEKRVWEPETFKILDQYLTREVYYLDVGAWIGPTAMFAATLAGHVCCVEPDPVARAILTKNMYMNGRRHKFDYDIIHGAICPNRATVVVKARGALGNSMTSIYGSGEGRVVDAYTIQRLGTGPDNLFVKMDTEGAEAEIIPGEIQFLCDNKVTVYLSLHWDVIPAAKHKGLIEAMYKMRVEDVHGNNIPVKDILNYRTVMLLPG